MRLIAIVTFSFALLASVGACGSTVRSVDLKVGDCVNETLTTDANGDQVRAYAPVDCATAHEDEVFSVFDYPSATSFPGYEAIGALQQATCQVDFLPYVGVTWDHSHYSISYSSPDEQSWSAGDHAIHCLLADQLDGKLTGSARGTRK